jgi:hypothetical protein
LASVRFLGKARPKPGPYRGDEIRGSGGRETALAQAT